MAAGEHNAGKRWGNGFQRQFNCAACGIEIVPSSTWRVLSPEGRKGKACNGGRSLCRRHYNRWARTGDPLGSVPRKPRKPATRTTDIRPREDVLVEWMAIRPSVRSVAEAAERMGMTAAALDKALYRARQAGDDRGVLPQHIRPRSVYRRPAA